MILMNTGSKMKTTKVSGDCYRVEGHANLLIMKFSSIVRRKRVVEYIAFRRNATSSRELVRGYTLSQCKEKLGVALFIESGTRS
jgi:hypothetical protein